MVSTGDDASKKGMTLECCHRRPDKSEQVFTSANTHRHPMRHGRPHHRHQTSHPGNHAARTAMVTRQRVSRVLRPRAPWLPPPRPPPWHPWHPLHPCPRLVTKTIEDTVRKVPPFQPLNSPRVHAPPLTYTAPPCPTRAPRWHAATRREARMPPWPPWRRSIPQW